MQVFPSQGTSVPPALGLQTNIPCIWTLSVALFPCDPSPMPPLRLPALLVYSQANFLSVTLCLGTSCRCVDSVPVPTARFASPGHHQILLGGTPLWYVDGAAFSISTSAARLPRLSARILLICGLISSIAYLVTLSWPRKCAMHCILTLLVLRMFATFGCRSSWILSASCLLVLAKPLLLCSS
jgi:hypothetical protein